MFKYKWCLLQLLEISYKYMLNIIKLVFFHDLVHKIFSQQTSLKYKNKNTYSHREQDSPKDTIMSRIWVTELHSSCWQWLLGWGRTPAPLGTTISHAHAAAVHDTVTSAVCGVSVCAWACVACGSDHILVKECAACYLFTLRRVLPACTSSGLPGVS